MAISAVAVIGTRYGGDCLPAGAGVLTWRRRRARRAPARQGAAGRRPGVGELPALPSGLAWSARRVAQYPMRSRFRVRSRPGAGRPGAPKACL